MVDASYKCSYQKHTGLVRFDGGSLAHFPVTRRTHDTQHTPTPPSGTLLGCLLAFLLVPCPQKFVPFPTFKGDKSK